MKKVTAKHHTIEIADLQKWLEGEYVTFASSKREGKRLVATLQGKLKVLVGNEVVWHGTQAFPAMEAYNSITEKYIDETKNFRI